MDYTLLFHQRINIAGGMILAANCCQFRTGGNAVMVIIGMCNQYGIQMGYIGRYCIFGF